MEHQNDTKAVPESLIPLRNEIDKIDHQILGLLSQRNRVVEEVAKVKKATGFGIRDFARETSLLADRGERAVQSGLSSDVVESLFRVILWASRDRQASLGAELPLEMDSKTIAIIGAGGQMGKWLANYFLYCTRRFTYIVCD